MCQLPLSQKEQQHIIDINSPEEIYDEIDPTKIHYKPRSIQIMTWCERCLQKYHPTESQFRYELEFYFLHKHNLDLDYVSCGESSLGICANREEEYSNSFMCIIFEDYISSQYTRISLRNPNDEWKKITENDIIGNIQYIGSFYRQNEITDPIFTIKDFLPIWELIPKIYQLPTDDINLEYLQSLYDIPLEKTLKLRKDFYESFVDHTSIQSSILYHCKKCHVPTVQHWAMSSKEEKEEICISCQSHMQYEQIKENLKEQPSTYQKRSFILRSIEDNTIKNILRCCNCQKILSEEKIEKTINGDFLCTKCFNDISYYCRKCKTPLLKKYDDGVCWQCEAILEATC